MRKKKNKTSMHIEVVEGYRNIWRYALRNVPKRNIEPRLLDTACAARKYGNFSGIENLIQEFLKTNPFEHYLIISLGCGGAKDLYDIKRIFPSSVLFGIDTSQAVLSSAKRKLANAEINLICASMSNLPFMKETRFDMLIAGQSIDLDFGENYLRKVLIEATNYSSGKSRFYMTFFGTSNTQLELYKCTPIGNMLEGLGWKTIYGTKYRAEKRGPYAQGVFWVDERV